MSKQKNPETATSVAQALDRLKKHQTPRIAGTHLTPFLTDPAEFSSRRTADEIAAIQEGQLIAVPKPKRSPSVMDIAEVIGAQQVDEIEQNGQIVFQTAGDTGTGKREDLGQVVQVMAMDFHRPNPADHPAFFF